MCYNEAMIKIVQKVAAVPFLLLRSVVRLIIWPAGVVWSYFADAGSPPAPEDLHFANTPVFLEGTNGRGILLLHGWTSTAYEMRALAKYLNVAGYTVSAPLLSGHGTVPRDLEHVTHKDWINDAQKYYDALDKKCDKVFVGGMSMGGSLALILAQRNRDIAGIIAMGTPFMFRRQRMGIVVLNLLQSLKKYEHKRYPIFGAHPQVTRLVSYQTYPIVSALEVFRLATYARKGLRQIVQPIFILQSSQDHIVARSSIYEIYLRVRSKQKEKKVLPGAYHNFIADIQHSHVYDDILAFMNKY